MGHGCPQEARALPDGQRFDVLQKLSQAHLVMARGSSIQCATITLKIDDFLRRISAALDLNHVPTWSPDHSPAPFTASHDRRTISMW
jgi:hypothetical protein